MSAFHEHLNAQVRSISRTRAEWVEEQILNGKNRVVVVDRFGDIEIGRSVWEVPRWREAPIRRARIAWARLRRRWSR